MDRQGDATPAPPAKLHVTLTTIAKGQVLHRVHLQRYRADQFNPGQLGNARFSPIGNDAGQPVPTLYASTTVDCALMETVFHDVSHATGFKPFVREKLAALVHSSVRMERALQVADLSSVALRKLGVTRRQLIDTDKDQYPVTRQWAAAIHHQCPQVQGLCWVSRQDDSARALMLFGDRIADDALRPHGDSRSLLDDGNAYDAILDLAKRIGVTIVQGIEGNATQ